MQEHLHKYSSKWYRQGSKVGWMGDQAHKSIPCCTISQPHLAAGILPISLCRSRKEGRASESEGLGEKSAQGSVRLVVCGAGLAMWFISMWGLVLVLGAEQESERVFIAAPRSCEGAGALRPQKRLVGENVYCSLMYSELLICRSDSFCVKLGAFNSRAFHVKLC